MKRFLGSFYRVASRSTFLAGALLLGLALWYLPQLLNLDQFRPRLTDILETTFHCQVIVGDVTGTLVPMPGVSLGPVVFLERSKTPQVLASVTRVQLRLTPAALLRGRLEFHSIRFTEPRFLIHRDQDSSGETVWSLLHLPAIGKEQAAQNVVDEWQIRSGSIELWDHATTPATRWTLDRLSGTFHARQQTGVFIARAPRLSSRALLDLHYDGSKSTPVHVQLRSIELAAFQPLVSTSVVTLEGAADLDLGARLEPAFSVEGTIYPTGGSGQAVVSLDSGRHGVWRWSSHGKDVALPRTDLKLTEWSAKNDEAGAAALVHGNTSRGGAATIFWSRAAADQDSQLDVRVSSVTIREILEVFHLESAASSAPVAFNPFGYEPWMVQQGRMHAVVHAENFEVTQSSADIVATGAPAGTNAMHLDLTGTFTDRAHIQGTLASIPVAPVVESFFRPPSPVTGTGRANVTLDFPLSNGWIAGLTGPVEIEVGAGVVHAVKTMYRIESLLNLGNYLRLRFPKVNASGIVMESLKGHLTFQNGVLSSEDLFLKSPDMNVGAKGSIDIPGKSLKTVLRLEMLRFLEDILRDVPITHWIFKKPNKILLPLVVHIHGPWDNPDVD